MCYFWAWQGGLFQADVAAWGAPLQISPRMNESRRYESGYFFHHGGHTPYIHKPMSLFAPTMPLLYVFQSSPCALSQFRRRRHPAHHRQGRVGRHWVLHLQLPAAEGDVGIAESGDAEPSRSTYSKPQAFVEFPLFCWCVDVAYSQ